MPTNHISLPDELEDLLMEGIQGGEATEMTQQDWKDIRAAELSQLEARKSSNPAE